jgi:aldose 1-epimerase
MTETIALVAHGFELDIAPLAGGGIARLDWQGHHLLRPVVGGVVTKRDPLGLSCFPMTPYVSRITNGVFTWGDVTTNIAPNMAGGAHPLHGIGWRKPWGIDSQSDTHIALMLNHDGDQDWPWAFSTRQDFVIHSDHIEHCLSVTSRDTRAFPSSLGPHPYFPSQDAVIEFDSAALWEISGESLPTHQARPQVVDDLAAGTLATDLALDHCFEGWNGTATITWPTHALRLEAHCKLGEQALPCTRLQLYTPKGADFFCLEPVSARCVAFTTGDPASHGVVNLRDETLSIMTKFVPSQPS